MTAPQAKTGVEVERLPELPPARHVNCGIDHFIAEDMRAYATEAIAAERAEAVRLSAALRDAIFELEFSGMAYDHPKLVSLRAALSPTQQGN